MNIWLITDTHFGHNRLVHYNGRPENFSELILQNISSLVKKDDLLIHLGDFCIKSDALWHKKFMEYPSRKWFLRGNHDKKSEDWYLKHGWQFIGDSIQLTYQEKTILFTHIPVPQSQTSQADLNIHGHFHNNEHRMTKEIISYYDPSFHKLLAIEFTNYKPVLLKKFIQTAEV